MKDLLINAIEKSLNAYLQQDPRSLQRLNKLSGKSIQIILQPFAFHFYCSFTDTSLLFSTDTLDQATATIEGTPLQLLNAALMKEHRRQFFAEDLKMTGDAEAAQAVVDLFDNVEIDWEEHTSRLLGDAATHHLSQFASRMRGWLNKTSSHIHSDLNDYLHEEKEWFPLRADLQAFFSEIDQLRMDTDRLEARIGLLNAALAEEEKS